MEFKFSIVFIFLQFLRLMPTRFLTLLFNRQQDFRLGPLIFHTKISYQQLQVLHLLHCINF